MAKVLRTVAVIASAVALTFALPGVGALIGVSAATAATVAAVASAVATVPTDPQAILTKPRIGSGRAPP